MKKLFIFSLLIESTFFLTAQVPFSLKEGKSAIVYSLPKTEFCFEVQTEKVTQKPGVFYRYSERYLATNKVITEGKTVFRLKSIQVKPLTIADPNRTYSFVAAKKSEGCHITLNSKGILCGVNVPFQVETASNDGITEVQIENSTQTALLPLGEEYMMAGSEAKLAEGAAKQIYRIRESRLGLLTADVEKLPADGASFKSMLEGLNKMEKELTELFIGTTTTETQSHKVFLTPDSTLNKQTLFRLSALLGVVSKDDLSGTPYYISIKPIQITQQAADPKVKPEPVEIYSLLPASTEVSISDGISIFYSGQFLVPQFGKTIPICKNLLQKPKVIIRVDQQTGRLLGIE